MFVKTFKLFIGASLFLLACGVDAETVTSYKMSRSSLAHTRAYWPEFRSNANHFRTEKGFYRVFSLPGIADHEKSYAHLYLGRIALDNLDLATALKHFAESERLHSTPYGYQILSAYYGQQGEKSHAITQLLLAKKWYEKRITELWDGSFDVANIQFWNTLSPMDGSTGAYKKYWVMYSNQEEPRLRWLTNLIFCYDGIDSVNDTLHKLGYVAPAVATPKESLIELCSIEQAKVLPAESDWFWFKTTKWTGEAKGKLIVYQKQSDGYPYLLNIDIIQQCNDKAAMDMNLMFEGLIKDDGVVYFKGYEGQYYTFSLMKTNAKGITLTLYYKMLFPVLSISDREELRHIELEFRSDKLPVFK